MIVAMVIIVSLSDAILTFQKMQGNKKTSNVVSFFTVAPMQLHHENCTQLSAGDAILETNDEIVCGAQAIDFHYD